MAPALRLGSAVAMVGPPAGQNLSPRLAKLAMPRVRSASDATQADKLGLADEGPGSLLRRGSRVLVYVRFERGAAAGLKALRAAGAKTVSLSSRYQTVTVAAKPGQLPSLGRVARVAGVTEALAPVAAAGPCPSGEVVSEGDLQLHAVEARAKFSDGSGIKVGILSDSFDQATEAANGGPLATTAPKDVESGDLPGIGDPPGTGDNPCGDLTPVENLEPDTGASEEEDTDEGRAMAQIVHDLAPKADIAFASAFNGEGAFANNVGKLAAAGAKVIVDDVFYLEEPFFQDGPVAVAAREAVGAGSTYFSAAGNNSLLDAEGREIGSWETPQYRDAGSCPPAVEELEAGHCLNFNPGAPVDRTFGIKVARGATLTVDLQWDEPWLGVGTDLDAFLLNSSGNLVASAGDNNVDISQKPLEVLEWSNESGSQRTVQLVINRFSGDSPRLKFGLIENGFGVTGTEYPRSSGEDVVGPTIFGHSGTAAAISVGAVPFNNNSIAEEYSSRGPVRHDFGPVEGAEAAAPLGSPEIVSKPDIAATDCGLTTFFASFELGGWRFCGTSAAAPHAAAVAALMLGEEPAATPEKIKAALQESAVEVSASDSCSVGAGLVEAVGAVEKLLVPVGPVESPCKTPEAEVLPDEARAPGDWGSEIPPTTPAIPPATPAPENPVTGEADHRRPRTLFLQRPDRVIRTHGRSARIVLRFGSDQAGVSYACRVDGGFFRPCPERFVRRFSVGSHSVLVVARNADGDRDRTPAIFRFKVKHVG